MFSMTAVEPSAALARPRRIVVLGSTGSIGTQALAIAAANPDAFQIVGLTAAGSDPQLLARQICDFQVSTAAIRDENALQEAREALSAEYSRRGLIDRSAQVLTAGEPALEAVAGMTADVVVNGVAGAAGLLATIAALDAGSIVALANKESLIIGGPVVTRRARPGQLIPVDSEHSAIAQALRAGTHEEVRRLVLTASGGPFRGRSRAQLADVTVSQALDHPTWSMGPLVTINSATMINKGLEVIEAHLLFNIPLDHIDVVVHPQSVVHSMVEFVDGSTLAQASPPDMRIPIAMGMAWPNRISDAAPGCDWTQAATWEFFPLDPIAFPAVDVARRAARAGGTAPAVFNAADEVAVAAFLAGELPFTGIVDTVGEVLDRYLADQKSTSLGNKSTPGDVLTEADLTVADVLAADNQGRTMATEIIESSRHASR
jgi:1-deoxy-D-xylulose-5-phosphate reductoisomerase